MQYGICNLGIVPIRLEPSDTSEMVTQALYGDYFKILEQRKKWSRIRSTYDKYEGCIDNKQYKELEESDYKSLLDSSINLSSDLIEYVYDSSNTLIETLTLTRSGANSNAPYKARIGTTAAGTRFISTVPAAAWYQPNSDTGGADQDETILYGND